jgi:Xaa-Pro aminopeptidase
MIVGAAAAHLVRLARLRADLGGVALDALVVSHLPNIRYLTSFRGTAGMLVVLPQRALLVVDFRYASAARGAVASAGLSGPEGVEVLVSGSSLDEAVIGLLRESAATRIGVEGQWMSIARFNKLAGALATGAPALVGNDGPCPTLVATERLVERARAIKDASEIETLREAGRRLAEVAGEAPGVARAGRTEIEVAFDIEVLLRRAGFERPAFETIVASGPNGALPHARPTARRLMEGEGVTLDFGGVYDGYCVDLTRTVELGAPPEEWRRLKSAVAEAQLAALAAVRPGVPSHEVDRAARDVLTMHGLGEAFGHATGHGIGLEVHEEPRIARPVIGQADVLLEPGMVFTVEPGAYVDGIGGVRIEDDVLVTDSGCEVLTRQAR